MTIRDNIDNIKIFLNSPDFAVVGASANREKFGNRVLRVYLQHHMKVYPVNPHEKTIEGIECINSVSDLPANVKSISIITPPRITEQVVDQAIIKGIKNIWMQPGAASDQAVKNCKQHQINVIAYGPCILLHLGFKE